MRYALFTSIHEMYVPENDAQPVSWTEFHLAEALEEAIDRIDALEKRLAALEHVEPSGSYAEYLHRYQGAIEQRQEEQRINELEMWRGPRPV